MSDNLNWLERVSKESADSNADIKPEGTGLAADEAVNEVGGDEQLTNEGKAGTNHEVELKDDTVVDDNPAAKEAVGEITTSTEDNDSQQAPDDVEIELTGDVPAEGGETPAEEPAATEVDASNDSGAAGGDVDGGVEQPAEEPTPDAVPAEVADASTSTTEAPVEPAPAEGKAEEIPVAIDPVLEIQEGTDAAVAAAQENPEVAPAEPAEAEPAAADGTDTQVEEEEGEEKPAEEDFDCVADDDITNPMDSVDTDVESLGVLTKSLEGYQELLNAEIGAGRAVSPVLAQSIMIGLKSLREPFLLKGQPSVEDFNDPTGKFVVSNELATGLAEKAAVVGGALLEAAKRLWEQLVDMFAQISHNVPALDETNQALVKQLAGLKDGKGGKVSVKGAGRLFIGDSFGGDVASNYATLGKFAAKFLVDYPKSISAMATTWMQGEEKDIASLAEAIGNGFLPNQWGLLGVDKSKAPEMYAKYENVFASAALLGNGRIVAGKSSVTAENGLDSLSDIWKIEFVKDTVQIDESATEVNLPSVANLRLITQALGELIKNVPQLASVDRGSFRNARNSLDKAFKESNVGQAGSGLVRSLTMPSGHLVGHVVNTIKVGQAFVAHCIKQHQGAAEA